MVSRRDFRAGTRLPYIPSAGVAASSRSVIGHALNDWPALRHRTPDVRSGPIPTAELSASGLTFDGGRSFEILYQIISEHFAECARCLDEDLCVVGTDAAVKTCM